MPGHERTSKVASRAYEGILVGFEGEHIYRIFVPILSRVVQSSHVKIWENIILEEGDWMRSWPKDAWRKSRKAQVKSDGSDDRAEPVLDQEDVREIRPWIITDSSIPWETEEFIDISTDGACQNIVNSVTSHHTEEDAEESAAIQAGVDHRAWQVKAIKNDPLYFFMGSDNS
ncbi:MAG: hypothetical protein SEPTF4163_002340 [Sporothrix epigloea]